MDGTILVNTHKGVEVRVHPGGSFYVNGIDGINSDSFRNRFDTFDKAVAFIERQLTAEAKSKVSRVEVPVLLVRPRNRGNIGEVTVERGTFRGYHRGTGKPLLRDEKGRANNDRVQWVLPASMDASHVAEVFRAYAEANKAKNNLLARALQNERASELRYGDITPEKVNEVTEATVKKLSGGAS